MSAVGKRKAIPRKRRIERSVVIRLYRSDQLIGSELMLIHNCSGHLYQHLNHHLRRLM